MHPVSQIICIVTALLILGLIFRRQRRGFGLLFLLIGLLPDIFRRQAHEKKRARYQAQENLGENDSEGFYPVPGKPEWRKGDYAARDQDFLLLPEAPEGFIHLWGWIEEADPGGWRLYRIPENCSAREIVETFDVGLRGGDIAALAQGGAQEKAIRQIEALLAMLPGKIVSAGSASLLIQFIEPVTDEHLRRINEIFKSEIHGLETYISAYDGYGEMFSEVKKSGTFHFWWD